MTRTHLRPPGTRQVCTGDAWAAYIARPLISTPAAAAATAAATGNATAAVTAAAAAVTEVVLPPMNRWVARDQYHFFCCMTK